MRKNKNIISTAIIFFFASAGFFLFPEISARSAGAKKQFGKPARIATQSVAGGNFVESEVVAKISASADSDAIARKYSLEITPLKSSLGENLYILRSTEGISTKKLTGDLEKNPSIVSVQPNYKYQKLSRAANDHYWREQWWFFDVADSAGGVGAASAWDSESKAQRDVAVAVIDSGANLKHNDFKKNLTKGSAQGYNFEYRKKKPTDSDGHGSFLAGVIAASSNNKKGLAGASLFNNLRVMPLRFDFTTSEAIEALNFAKAKSVPVVNASWGGYGEEGYDELLQDAISEFPGVFVTAAGNYGYDHDGEDPNQKMYPCDFDLPNIICVGATDRNGNLADYSDYGATSVDVAAPGGTDDSPIMSLSGSKQKYTYGEGSSVSTAFVSAEAGLLISKYPNLTNVQVIEIIKNSTDSNATLTGRVATGGKVNFQKAFDLAASY